MAESKSLPDGAYYFIGIALGFLFAVVIMTIMMRMNTPGGWCDNIARDSAEPYAVVYDRCMADVERRHAKGIW